MEKTLQTLPIIGRSEGINLVGLYTGRVPAKIDSGAFRSAIHASEIVVESGVLTCTLLDGHSSIEGSAELCRLETSDFEIVKTKSSFGVEQDRFTVELKVEMMGEAFVASFGLADRSSNRFPILIGRQVTNNRFLINTAIANAETTKPEDAS